MNYYLNDGSPYLMHFGVKGMKWGVRKDRKRGSARPRAKIKDAFRLLPGLYKYSKNRKAYKAAHIDPRLKQKMRSEFYKVFDEKIKQDPDYEKREKARGELRDAWHKHDELQNRQEKATSDDEYWKLEDAIESVEYAIQRAEDKVAKFEKRADAAAAAEVNKRYAHTGVTMESIWEEDFRAVAVPVKHYDDSPYLMHHGVKGMHWGVRRYQNRDGTRTALGRQRMSKEERREARYQKKRAKWAKTPQGVYKHWDHFSDDERARLQRRFEQQNRMRSLAPRQTDVWGKIDKGTKIAGTVLTIAGLAGAVKTGYDTYKGNPVDQRAKAATALAYGKQGQKYVTKIIPALTDIAMYQRDKNYYTDRNSGA